MKNYCLNCERRLSEEATYCPSCGQARKTYLLSFKSLMLDFFDDMFNLNNRIFKSLRKILFPWKISQDYIAGRRRQYTNPIRLFMVMLIIHFTIFSFTYVRNINERSLGKLTNIESQVTLSQKLEAYNALVDSIDMTQDQRAISDTIRNRLFNNVKSTDQDTFSPPLNLQISGTRFKDFGILKKDVVELSEKELLEKYPIGNFLDRLLVRQSIRIYKKPIETLRFFIGNMIWGVFLIVFFLGLVLKVLYLRHGILYVEHLVFLFAFHASALFIGCFGMLADYFGDIQAGMNGYSIAFLIKAILLFVALKKYYQQGFFKTLIKYFIVLFAYLAALSFVVFIIFFATILIF